MARPDGGVPQVTRALAATLFAALLLVPAAGTHGIKEGGTFRIASATARFTAIDPAFSNPATGDRLLTPACGTLVAYPDMRPPAAYRIAPSLAEAEPRVSRDGHTYTFTIRRDARFSTDAPVTARTFVHALERILTPAMKSDLAGVFEDILGARKMLAGKKTTLDGAIARGRTLTLRLNKPDPLLLHGLTRLCAVPPNLQADPEGARAPLPSAAPYYVSEYVPGERLVLERNRFYKGSRPHHVDRFVVDLASDFGPGIDQVASGSVDVFWPGPMPEQRAELAQRYGFNKSQFFMVAGSSLRVFVLNTRRPLLRNNVKLRQALNFAVDRRALVRESGPRAETPTDQYLLPTTAGYRDEDIYPRKGPDLRTARALAKGNLRGRKAVLYTLDQPAEVARAEILKRNLKAIGLELEVKAFPLNLFFEKIGTPGEPFDLARVLLGTIPDPVYLNEMLSGYTRQYDRLLDRAARLRGEERYRAYGALDVEISRDVAPMIPVSVVNWPTFVSARVDCIVLTPVLNLTAVCLK
jgi:peptide/nickel transport system substrate-binding protein